MDVHSTIFELIDMRSFSNLWFWIALAVMWSTASHWVLGVPFDMVSRARRQGGQAVHDLEDMVRVHTTRLAYIAEVTGTSLLSFACFMLTSLALLGFVYRVEFAQALFLLALPMCVVTWMNMRTALRIRNGAIAGDALPRLISRQRTYIQIIGMLSIFVTALWGMYQNLTVGPFGS